MNTKNKGKKVKSNTVTNWVVVSRNGNNLTILPITITLPLTSKANTKKK